MFGKTALILAGAAVASAHVLHMTVPPISTDANPNQGFGRIGGTIEPTTLPTQNPNDYKLVLYISGNQGGTWWDKMHTLYLVYLNDPDAGDDQMQGIPVHADWSWNMTQWATPGAITDGTSTYFRAYVIPYSYDTKWPEYEIEGSDIPGTLIAASYGGMQIDRGMNVLTYYDAGGVVSGDQTVQTPDGVGVAPISDVPVVGNSATPSASRNASMVSPGGLGSSGVDSLTTVGVAALTAVVASFLIAA